MHKVLKIWREHFSDHIPLTNESDKKGDKNRIDSSERAEKVRGEKRGGPWWHNITNIRLFTKQNTTLGHFV